MIPAVPDAWQLSYAKQPGYPSQVTCIHSGAGKPIRFVVTVTAVNGVPTGEVPVHSGGGPASSGVF